MLKYNLVYIVTIISISIIVIGGIILNSNQLLIIIIIITLAISVIMMMPKFFKAMSCLLINCGIGLLCIYFINMIAPIDWQVGLNVYTGVTVSVLGLPGVVLLYAIKIMG